MLLLYLIFFILEHLRGQASISCNTNWLDRRVNHCQVKMFNEIVMNRCFQEFHSSSCQTLVLLLMSKLRVLQKANRNLVIEVYIKAAVSVIFLFYKRHFLISLLTLSNQRQTIEWKEKRCNRSCQERKKKSCKCGDVGRREGIATCKTDRKLAKTKTMLRGALTCTTWP